MFTISGRPLMAEWVFDPRRRHVSPADDDAARLSLPEADLAGLAPGPRAPARATVTPIGSRLAAAAPPAPVERRPEPRPEPAASPGPLVNPARAAGAHPVRPPEVHPARAAETQPARAPGARSPGAPEARPARVAEARTVETRAAEAASAEPRAAEARPAAELAEAAPDAGSQEQPVAPQRGRGRKAAGGRSRRSSVPSWDEIMFGTSRQPE
jgi:hypothetical protein